MAAFHFTESGPEMADWKLVGSFSSSVDKSGVKYSLVASLAHSRLSLSSLPELRSGTTIEEVSSRFGEIFESG